MIKRLVLFALLLFAAPAFAEDAKTATAARPVPPGFERVAGGADTEKVDANKLVVIAYIIFFMCMFGYVVYVARSQAAIAKEMAELGERIRRAEKK